LVLVDVSVVEQRYRAVLMVLGGAKVIEVAPAAVESLAGRAGGGGGGV
jgi:hypothetical protein